jgi:hypothetical protein
MKNYIYSTIVLFLISFNTFERRAPTWAVNEVSFNIHDFVGALHIDGVRL